MAELIHDLVAEEVHRQLTCQREDCGHFIWEHDPKFTEKMGDWGYCHHYDCQCFGLKRDL